MKVKVDVESILTVTKCVKFKVLEDLLTTKDVAQLLGVSASRVRQLILEGRIPSVKMGRDLWVKRNDLAQFSVIPRKRTGRPSKS